jgi:hypothetical protein
MSLPLNSKGLGWQQKQGGMKQAASELQMHVIPVMNLGMGWQLNTALEQCSLTSNPTLDLMVGTQGQV